MQATTETYPINTQKESPRFPTKILGTKRKRATYHDSEPQVPKVRKLDEPDLTTYEMRDGGVVELYKGFLPKSDADELYEESKFPSTSPHMNWNQEVIKMFGKSITAPRKTAFLGESDGLTYKYSGTCKESVTWSPLVESIKTRIEETCGHKFNVVLLNWYEDGSSYIGWHSDDEKDMPKGSKIASISVGMSREFCLKHKSCKGKIDTSNSDDYLSVTLDHGDLLVMGGTLQQFWKHQLPKLKKNTPSSPRINFTFRLVKSDVLKTK